MKTETPGTGAFLEAWKSYPDSSLNGCPGSMADFARQLERELNTQKEPTACAEKNLSGYQAMSDPYDAEAAK
jgi:hypothetical protein